MQDLSDLRRVLDIRNPCEPDGPTERTCGLFQACKKVRLETRRVTARQVTMSADDQDFKRALVWDVVGQHRKHFATVEQVKDPALPSPALLATSAHHFANSSERRRQPTLYVI